MDTSMFPPTITETFDEARRAILPTLVQKPELAEKVSALGLLAQDESVKTYPHYTDGGTFHVAGRLQHALPLYLMVCDRCGHNYTSR